MPELRCWPGCKAIIIKSNLGNLGKVVRVIRPAPKEQGQRFMLEDGNTWRHNPAYGPPAEWIVESMGSPLIGRKFNGDKFTCLIRPMPDSSLQPLPEDPETMFNIMKEIENV